MSCCEKCWTDSIAMGLGYHELLRQRVKNPCSPEEQAGPDAGECPKCKRKTLHQHTNQPMCGCPAVSANPEAK